MKRSQIIALASVVLVGAAALLVATSQNDEGQPESASQPASAKLSSRPKKSTVRVDGHQTPRDHQRVDRANKHTEGTAEDRFLARLSVEQRDQLEQARQQFAASHRMSDEADLQAQNFDRRLARFREQIRTSILTNPDGWTEEYAMHKEAFDRQYGGSSYYGGGAVLPPSTSPETAPTSPTDPAPNPAPDTNTSEPSLEDSLSISLEEAQRISREFRELDKVSGPTREQLRILSGSGQ